MKATRTDGGAERKILIGLVTDARFLGRVARLWTREGLLSSRWANAVAGWCVHHHRSYGKAPGTDLKQIFEDWEQSGRADKETVSLIGDFLETISDEFERTDQESTQYLEDLADKHFNLVRLRKLRDQLEADVLSGDAAAALDRVSGFSRIEISEDSEVDVLLDEESIREALDESENEDMIVYPGDLGWFFKGTLTRGGFVALDGPEKRGKTNQLIDMAWRAMLNRKRVAFFEVGDMSRRQIMRRFMSRASRRPFRPGTVKIPTDLTVTKEGPKVTFKTKIHTNRLDWQTAWEACQRVCKEEIKSKRSFLKLRCYPTVSVSVADVRARVEDWVRDGWVPDVVVIDYADILKPVDQKADKLDRINQTWAALRALSLSGPQPLVLTATQTNRASYRARVILPEHTGEDKRKLAHVTGMVGLNRTPEEKDLQLLRLNWVAGREWKYNEYACWTVAGCPAIASPCMRSAAPLS